jgi:hypothetical protein
MTFQVEVEDLGQYGVIKDLKAHRLPKNAFSDATQMRFGNDGATQLNAERAVMDSAASPITDIVWLQQFPTSAAPLWMYSNHESAGGVGDASIYVVDSGNPVVHTDITRVAGTYNSTPEERPHAGVFQGLGYWNNTQDVPQLWADMVVGTPMKDFTNWGTHDETGSMRCQFMRNYKNFLMMGNLTEIGGGSNEYPFRVRWSDAASPGTEPSTFSVSDTTKLAGERDLAETPGYVIDGLELGEIFVVYKEQSTIGFQVILGANVMRRWTIFPNTGILHRDCVMGYPGGHLVCTQDDIIHHNGVQGSQVTILEDRLRDHVFSQLNAFAYYNSFMVRNTAKKEIWFCYPTGASTYATEAVIWHWAENTVGLRSLPNIPFASAGPIVTNEEPVAWDP